MTTPEKEFCEWNEKEASSWVNELGQKVVFITPHEEMKQYYGKPNYCPFCGKSVKIKEQG